MNFKSQKMTNILFLTLAVSLFPFQNCSQFKVTPEVMQADIQNQSNASSSDPTIRTPTPNPTSTPNNPQSLNQLNDTGVEMCGDLSAMSTALCNNYMNDSGSYPRQDGNIGRDALTRSGSLTKIGSGPKGFDFTKISNSGSSLSTSATQGMAPTDWGCTKDNVTGLTWEVKTTSGLHNSVDTFSWYKYGIGTQNGGTCATNGRCDTEKFVADVNAVGLCGFSDWRLPTVTELEGIADLGVRLLTFDTSFFPHSTSADTFWASTTDANNTPAQFSWALTVANGASVKSQHLTSFKVQLVRGSPISKQLILSSSGKTVTDSASGLMWKRDYEMNRPGFPEPQFSAVPDTYDWNTALIRSVNDRTDGHADWRLPNIKELRSLVDHSRVSPAIDPVFPSLVPASVFWSSTPAQSYNHYLNLSWCVQFDGGVPLNTMGRSAKLFVRLVRNPK